MYANKCICTLIYVCMLVCFYLGSIIYAYVHMLRSFVVCLSYIHNNTHHTCHLHASKHKSKKQETFINAFYTSYYLVEVNTMRNHLVKYILINKQNCCRLSTSMKTDCVSLDVAQVTHVHYEVIILHIPSEECKEM